MAIVGSSRFANQGGSSGDPGTFKPNPGTRIGTNIQELGKGDLRRALVDWNKVFQQAEQGIPEAKALIDQFRPGGDFGAGLRQESREAIQQGVAQDTAQAVAAGSSSVSSARGINTLAGSEFGKSVANIEDLRATLQVQSFTPYTQLLNNLSSLISARPSRKGFVDTITTPEFTGSGTGTKRGRG